MNKLYLFVLISFLTMPLQASLISIDDINFGSDTITIDTENNLEWLDLNLSTGFSYNELIAGTNTGGVFDDFRLAEIPEIQTLFDSAMLPAIGSTTTDFLAVDSLIDLIGSTSDQDGYLQSIGITATEGDRVGHRVTGLDFFYSNGIPTYSLIGGLTYLPMEIPLVQTP